MKQTEQNNHEMNCDLKKNWILNSAQVFSRLNDLKNHYSVDGNYREAHGIQNAIEEIQMMICTDCITKNIHSCYSCKKHDSTGMI